MCGIAGIFGKDNPDDVARMLHAIQHRGADETHMQSWDGACQLGINRLSILDVENGHQPLSNDNYGIHVVCNGEIYNHESIRSDLADTHEFKTGSDAEVIIHLYRKIGTECVRQLDGMFAFIVYDSVKKTFFAARDRFGIKPLYYANHNDCWYFASEAKAFVHLGLPDGKIRSLPPGYALTPRGPEQWFKIDDMRRKSVVDARLLRALLEHSVDKHLMCDSQVKLGVFLSGGIDSSIVAALAATRRQDIVAFTVGSPESVDVIAAKCVARHLGIRHVIVPFTVSEILELLPQAVYSIESYNPMLVIEGLMTMLMARAANAEGIKVVLCGEGSDEIFGGYGVFRDNTPAELDSSLRRALGNIHNTECFRLDRGTMAYSVEGRVPFLDPQVVEYAINLPAEYLIRHSAERRIEKWILRKAVEDLLPSEVVWRAKTPFDHGSGALPIYDEISSTISDSEYIAAQQAFPEAGINSKATLYCFRIWHAHFGNLAGSRTHDLFGSYPTLQSVIDSRAASRGGTGESEEALEVLHEQATNAWQPVDRSLAEVAQV